MFCASIAVLLETSGRPPPFRPNAASPLGCSALQSVLFKDKRELRDKSAIGPNGQTGV